LTQLELDARTDWILRYVALHDGKATAAGIAAVIPNYDDEETPAKITTSLKRLEKAGYVTSEKVGTAFHWAATDEGRAAHA
jgi:predicted transcriptional regulator